MHEMRCGTKYSAENDERLKNVRTETHKLVLEPHIKCQERGNLKRSEKDGKTKVGKLHLENDEDDMYWSEVT